MTGITLERVCKVFPGGVTAVEDLDLEVADQELMVLAGPSGCGKTTTLRMIAGLEDLTGGVIRIGQRVVNQMAARHRNLALVFQNPVVYPHLSVYKNLAFGLELRYGASWFSRLCKRLTRPHQAVQLRTWQREIPQRVQQVAQLLGLEPMLDRLPRQLSGGQRQRVALGRAFVRRPAAFLLDEPLSSLDGPLRAEMGRQLSGLRRQLGATMIYVTHDQAEALVLGDRLAIMDRGRLQQVGTPREVYDRPRNRFVAGFVGCPPMNFVEGELQDVGGQLRFRAPGMELGLAADTARQLRQPGQTAGTQKARRAVLGVRPEHVALKQVGPHGWVEAARAVVAAVQWAGDTTRLELALAGPPALENNSYTLVSKAGAHVAASMGASMGDSIGDDRIGDIGDKVQLWVDQRHIHLFDPHTGTNLNGTKKMAPQQNE